FERCRKRTARLSNDCLSLIGVYCSRADTMVIGQIQQAGRLQLRIRELSGECEPRRQGCRATGHLVMQTELFGFVSCVCQAFADTGASTAGVIIACARPLSSHIAGAIVN